MNWTSRMARGCLAMFFSLGLGLAGFFLLAIGGILWMIGGLASYSIFFLVVGAIGAITGLGMGVSSLIKGHDRSRKERIRSFERRVLDLLSHSSITAVAAAQKLGEEPAKVEQMLIALEKQGYVESEFSVHTGQKVYILDDGHQVQSDEQRLNSAIENAAFLSLSFDEEEQVDVAEVVETHVRRR